MRCGFVIEDLVHVRNWLVRTLETAFPDIRVYSAASCTGARALLREQSPDIVLMDLGLPDGSGLDLLPEFARQCPDGVLVVTTISDDDHHLFAALRAGAHGYLLKDHSMEELVEFLTGIPDGRPPLSPPIARRLLDTFRGPDPDSGVPSLTARERDVLALLAKGCTIAQAAEVLTISPHTCSGYVKEIYRKLKVSSRAEAAIEAVRLGLVPVG